VHYHSSTFPTNVGRHKVALPTECWLAKIPSNCWSGILVGNIRLSVGNTPFFVVGSSVGVSTLDGGSSVGKYSRPNVGR
jgi:hypothetical protein